MCRLIIILIVPISMFSHCVAHTDFIFSLATRQLHSWGDFIMTERSKPLTY